jgi:hypothetical protein
VDYWDYIGWKDPYAKQAFSARQRKMASLARAAIVYTPQVLLQGRDFRHWAGGAFEREVAKINAQPAKARISLLLDAAQKDAFAVEAGVILENGVAPQDLALYLGAYENKLVSDVTGENRAGPRYSAFAVGRAVQTKAPNSQRQRHRASHPVVHSAWSLSCKTGRVARSCKP